MSDEGICNLIKEKIDKYDYNSVIFRLALMQEGELWKVIIAKIVLDVAKPQGQKTLLNENNFALENFSLPIDEFKKFLDYIKTVYIGKVGTSASTNITDDLLFKIGNYKLCFVGNFPGREDSFFSRQVAKSYHGVDKPLYFIDYYIQESFTTKAYHKIVLSGHEIPLRNVAEALNYYWGTHFDLSNMYPNCGIYMPIYEASIASCNFEETSFKFKFDIDEKRTKTDELSLAVIAQGKELEYRQNHYLTSNKLEVNVGFEPTFASIFLNKNKTRIDEFNYYSPTVEANLPNVGRVVRERGRERERITESDSKPEKQEVSVTKEPTVFVSHAIEDIKLAKEIKSILELLGLHVFIAHQDIKPFEIWEDVIFKQLKSSAIFVPLLTTDFQRSIWTDQETGIALSSGSVVLPVIIDVDPYGFIAKYQGLRWNSQEFYFKVAELASQIIEHLPNDEKKKLRMEIIDNLSSYGKCRSYDVAGVFTRVISNFPSLTRGEINLVARGVCENDQVQNSGRARSSISTILNRYKDQLDPKYRNNRIIKKYIL